MGKKVKVFLFAYFIIAVFLTTGCIDKTVKPAVVLEVTGVAPYSVQPTATDTASLPEVTVSITSLSKVPCNLRTISVTYLTPYGEAIPQLEVSPIPVEGKIDAEGSLDVAVKPYTSRVVNLYELSSSDISPITAKITISVEDYNGNWISREAHCLLYAP